MEKEKNNKYPWESLDTRVLMLPIEVITYHLYRYEVAMKAKRSSEASKEMTILKSYIKNEKEEEVEVEQCFRK